MLRILFVVTLQLLAHAPAPAQIADQQVPGPPASSLSQALDLAWQRLPAAAALPHRLAEAEATARAARGWTPGPPAVALSNVNDRLNARTGRQEWEVELTTPLWLPGQREAQLTRALSQQALLAAQANARRLELAGRLREAWWQLAGAQAAVLAAQRRVDSARALQSDVERRWRAGDVARTDANAAQAEAQAALIEQVAARREWDEVRAAWRELTGTTAPATFAEEAAASAPSAIEAHPDLAAAGAALDAAQARLRLAEHSRREAPELALRWVRDRDFAGEAYVNRLGVQLRLPLSSPPRTLAELAGVRAELIEAETSRERLREQLQRGAERARSELEATTQMLALARQRATLASDTLQLLHKSFALGETDLATLLRARAEAASAEAEATRHRLSRSAVISRLNQALGALP